MRRGIEAGRVLAVFWLIGCGTLKVRGSERTVTNTDQRVEIRRLFEAAAACGDRYHCPSADQLDARAREPGDPLVLEVAFDLMTDPKVRSFDRLGTAAFEVARAWAHSRVQAGTFDETARSTFLAGVRRILDDSASTFVIPAYSLLDGPIGYAIPEARQLLTDEAVNPKRSPEEMSHATSGLRHYTTDLSQVRKWLESQDRREVMAGVSLLDHVDHSLIRQEADELPLLLVTAQRGDLPADVALGLVEHVRAHEDNAFLPVLEILERHGDATVRSKAKEATTHVKQAEAERAKRAS